MNEVKKAPEKEMFNEWNFAVSVYDFKIPNWDNAWDVVNLVKLKTAKKRWSDETNSYYNQEHYIVISHKQLISFIKSINSMVSA
jgi:hypothetical protein